MSDRTDARFWLPCHSCWTALGLLLAALLISKQSEASVPTRLVYVRSGAAVECAEQAVLEKAVSTRLGYDPFSPWGEQTILATISQAKRGLVARADLVDREGITRGTREFEAGLGDCAELIATLALAISITLDPIHVASAAPVPDRVGAAPDDQPSDSASEVAPAVKASQPSQSGQRTRLAGPARQLQQSGAQGRWAAYVYAGAFGAWALVPHATVGARVGGALRRGDWALLLEANASLPAVEPAGPGRRVRMGLLSSALGLCIEVAAPLSLCALGTLGRLQGEGEGVAAPRVESRFYAAVGARALVRIPLGPVIALTGGADSSAVLTRPTFELLGVDVWRPGPLNLTAGLGIEARFL
jgi:hypothetical protein